MTPLQGAALAVTVYLALLARSAWKQGELRKFAVSLGIVAGLIGFLVAVTAIFIWVDRQGLTQTSFR